MTSLRKRKKAAARAGLTEPGLQLVELVEELLEVVRWQLILGYANQFLIERRLEVDRDERDRVLEAATRAVEADRRLQGWRRTLAGLRADLAERERVALRVEPGPATRPAGRRDAAAPTARDARGPWSAREGASGDGRADATQL